MVSHFFFGNINGGEHRFCLLRFQYVIDGNNGRNVAFFAVALQTVKNAGENGFGYDPIFYLPEKGKTTAQLSAEEKNEISHRGKALRQIKEIL